MAPAIDPRTPCIIGVGHRTWHPADAPEGAPEPLDMWEDVARAAAADAGAPGALERLESIDVVYAQSWQYDDPPGRLAERLGSSPSRHAYSGIGGSVPQVLASERAAAIAAGDLGLGLIVGAEALATVRRLKMAGERPQWSHRPAGRRPFPMEMTFLPSEISHGVFEAFLTFALFDNARRAHLGRAPDAHVAQLGRLLAPLTEVAAGNPDAWFPVARSAAEIVTATADNRMVAYPYTKLMTAIMDVDMAAALLVAGTAEADALGVPEDKRVYLRGSGYALDPDHVAAHRDLWRSPAMSRASGSALRAAGIGIDDVAHFDLYSCFASSVSFALDALGRAEDDGRGVTQTGGLPYHGGPGSNYMTHALAAMAETLRSDPGSYGLVSGVGMHMTKHAYGVWSSDPGAAGPAAVHRDPEPGPPATELVDVVDAPEGPATVATYSVRHGRDGAPASALLVCDLPGGARCYATLEGGTDALTEAETVELIGRAVSLTPADGINLARLR
ncbi:MAG: acetyl-CoA synthetase [Acidimicrobiales bacterium]